VTRAVRRSPGVVLLTKRTYDPSDVSSLHTPCPSEPRSEHSSSTMSPTLTGG
jgi:hypothetical protein